MVDERIKQYAKLLVEHSTKVKKGERVVIGGDTIAEPLIKEIYRLCLKKGAYPAVHVHLPGMAPLYYKNASDDQLKRFPEVAMYEAKMSDVFIGVSGTTNTRELSGVDPKKMAIRSKTVNPISKVRMKKRWVGCDFPTDALAIEAGMSLEEYEDFLYGACLVDYNKMRGLQERLKKVVDKGTEVRIVGENTDLRMSIKGMTARASYGIYNVPDGEVFTAPEKYSVEGHIEFSYPAIRGGNEVEGIYVEFKKGKAVVAKAKKNEKFLKTMLAMDPGSSYLGELGIGTNYKITRYTKNLLFDEKIGGTVHLAFGMGYPECGVKNKKNLNDSALHWDIVKDMRKGGRLYVDGKLIQKDGKFLI
ncbi:TPA: aminopeptidase [Candidatus Woesearchaeota archaeon]|nr:aminopeptidase [Candidatus Woesearchaeota archaeon]